MTDTLTGDRLLARAFVASLALHLALFALIPALVASEVPGAETLSFVRIVRLREIHPPPRPPHSVAATAPRPAVVPHVTPARSAVAFTPRRVVVDNVVPQVQRAPLAAPIHPGTDKTDVSATAPPVVETNKPQNDSEQHPPAAQPQVGGMMPLGAEDPVPVIEPAAREALAALGVHVTLTVDVDEHGHVTSVTFAPPLDPALEERIRSMLASASWDPAFCGAGIACEGKATIRL